MDAYTPSTPAAPTARLSFVRCVSGREPTGNRFSNSACYGDTKCPEGLRTSGALEPGLPRPRAHSVEVLGHLSAR